MAEPLHIEIDRDGSDLVVQVAGDLDLTNASELVRFVEQLTEITVEPRVVVDASQVLFMDSTGAQALILSNRRCADAGGQLVIRSPSRPVQQILEVTGLDQVLTVDRA